jgi:hypothetical protein
MTPNDGRLSKNHSPRHVGSNLFEQLQPFRSNAVFPQEKPSGIAARPRQAVDVAGADRVGDSRKHNRNGAGRLQQ